MVRRENTAVTKIKSKADPDCSKIKKLPGKSTKSAEKIKTKLKNLRPGSFVSWTLMN
jgi:hypothetical protein